jgi:hypothetical protein
MSQPRGLTQKSVSALNSGTEMRYQIVAAQRPSADAIPGEPNLEDAYVALMQTAATQER